MEVVAAEREARSKEREGLMKELGERQRQWESDKLRSDNEMVRQVQSQTCLQSCMQSRPTSICTRMRRFRFRERLWT